MRTSQTFKSTCDLGKIKYSILKKLKSLKETVNSTIESLNEVFRHLYIFPAPNFRICQLEPKLYKCSNEVY